MSKKASRFSRSSGWKSRQSGTAEKGNSPRPLRADVSAGSQNLADGGSSSITEVMKHRLITQVKILYKEGKLEELIKCPLCKQPVSPKNFSNHVRRKH